MLPTVASYSNFIGAVRSKTPSWCQHIIDGGKDAAFVDTCYLYSLINVGDDKHNVIQKHYNVSRSVLYTSSLVIAEAIRQISKSDLSRTIAWSRLDDIKAILIDNKKILIVSPPRDVIESAINLVSEAKNSIDRLDLCDALSVSILVTLRHRRVYGFDSDLSYFGAMLEPM